MAAWVMNLGFAAGGIEGPEGPVSGAMSAYNARRRHLPELLAPLLFLFLEAFRGR